MLNNTHRCVIDRDGYYVEYVLLIGQPDGSTAPYAYILNPGESLLEASPPSGMIAPRWNGVAWEETGTRVITPEEMEQLCANKIQVVNAACTTAIHAGVDVETSEGVEHFALTEEDQINIQNLMLQVQAGQQTVPYHADGKLCRPFTADEVMALAAAATAHKTWHLTYCNHLREWIRREEELDGITYGAELPEDLAESMAALLGI